MLVTGENRTSDPLFKGNDLFPTMQQSIRIMASGAGCMEVASGILKPFDQPHIVAIQASSSVYKSFKRLDRISILASGFDQRVIE
jgi:hypothetical protein